MLQPHDPLLNEIVFRLAEVPGVAAVVLGGSRARGTANESSDYDIGLYFSSAKPFDVRHLSYAVRDMVEDPALAVLTGIGEWGPRIVGGGWLTIQRRKVDLLYRCVEDVRATIAECRAGRVSMAYQPGHPHGFASSIWMGEIALCRPLSDPAGVIDRLKGATSPYPEQLREALLNRFVGEVAFSIDNATIAIPRGDHTHIAGCAYRALCCVAQVLFALNRRYLINEKGALEEAAFFPHNLSDLRERVAAIWAAIGHSDFDAAIAGLRGLDAELNTLTRGSR